MSAYSIVTRGDEFSESLKSKIQETLIQSGYTYDEIHPETVFVIGGDGTFLSAIHQYTNSLDQISFIGIHTGTLGFMCDHPSEDLEELLATFVQKQPSIYTYPLLEVTLEGFDETIYAFNEARIENMVNTLTLDLSINNEFFETFKGSGICLCTQIGSTAINRSLGGAIIQHGLPLMELSEIMGVHHRKHRSLRSSLILKEDAIIHIQPKSFQNAMLCYDHLAMSLDGCTAITMKNSHLKVRIARYKKYSYLKRLKNIF